jgi:glycosyltransferase involved in cell wall biosynthesis
MVSVEVVVIARNEAEHLRETISCLLGQSVRPQGIVLVNDGSTDDTKEIATRMGCRVVDLPTHTDSYLGRPQLAEVLNAGLREVSPSAEFVMIDDADHPLPLDYIEMVTERMTAEGIVAASGSIIDEPDIEELPRNSGMIVKTSVWREVSGLQYPIQWGYESWLMLKMRMLGYKTARFTDIRSAVARGTRLKGANDGRAMYALGYHWKYALGRVLVNMKRYPLSALEMLYGYMTHRGVVRYEDISSWVGTQQKTVFWSKVKKRLAP